MNKELETYLGDRQNDALFIESLLAAAILCSIEKRRELLFELIDAAHSAAAAMNTALDAVNLPKGGDA